MFPKKSVINIPVDKPFVLCFLIQAKTWNKDLKPKNRFPIRPIK